MQEVVKFNVIQSPKRNLKSLFSTPVLILRIDSPQVGSGRIPLFLFLNSSLILNIPYTAFQTKFFIIFFFSVWCRSVLFSPVCKALNSQNQIFDLCIHPEAVFCRTGEILQMPSLFREANVQVCFAEKSPKLTISVLPPSRLLSLCWAVQYHAKVLSRIWSWQCCNC